MSDVAPRAIDAEVIERAHRESRLLLTEDKDFGELVFRQARSVPGIVLLRIDSARRSLKGTRLQAAVDRFGQELFWSIHGHRGGSVPFASVEAATVLNARDGVSILAGGPNAQLSQQEQSFAPFWALGRGPVSAYGRRGSPACSNRWPDN